MRISDWSSDVCSSDLCKVAYWAANGARLLRQSWKWRTRMASSGLDRTDLQLLAELQHRVRLTNAELAERVHLSPSACLRRVQRLERDGVLAGYRAEVDPAHVGLGLQAFVRVPLTTPPARSVPAFAPFVT